MYSTQLGISVRAHFENQTGREERSAPAAITEAVTGHLGSGTGV